MCVTLYTVALGFNSVAPERKSQIIRELSWNLDLVTQGNQAPVSDNSLEAVKLEPSTELLGPGVDEEPDLTYL